MPKVGRGDTLAAWGEQVFDWKMVGHFEHTIEHGFHSGRPPARAGWRAGRGLGVSGEGRHIADRFSVVRVLWLRSSNGLESLDCWMKFPYL